MFLLARKFTVQLAAKDKGGNTNDDDDTSGHDGLKHGSQVTSGGDENSLNSGYHFIYCVKHPFHSFNSILA